MPISYHSPTVRRETLHTVSLVAPHLGPRDTVLDVGCGEGYVLEQLREQSGRAPEAVCGTDIVDIRRTRSFPFQLYDGLTLPFPDRRFDLVMLTFVLHHVPDERKLALVKEAVRVSRAKVLIIEDTPRNALDRLFNRRHGEAYRRRIGSTASFGFLTRGEWRWLFRGMGFDPEARTLSRFCRSLLQPFARTAFLLRVAV